MKTLTKRGLIGAAMVFGMSGLALADDGKACTVQTLRGSYLFAASGFNIVAGVAQPKAIVEGIDFNGDGTLSVPAATISVNGVIGQIPAGGVGNYTVEPDWLRASSHLSEAQALTCSSRRPLPSKFG